MTTARGVTARTRGISAHLMTTLSWARRDVRSRYRQSGLHFFWSVLQPVSVVAVYAVVFRKILGVDSDGLPYLSFLVVGMVVWRYFGIALNQATCLIDHAEIMGKIRFHRDVIPLSACVGGLLDLAIGTVVMVTIAAIQGIGPALTLIALVPTWLTLVFYTATAAILLSTISVFVRDVAMAMPTIQQAMFFATPIMYGEGRGALNFPLLQYVNPLWFVIGAARDATLVHQWPDLGSTVLHLAVSAGLFTLSVMYLRSIEHRIVDIA